MLPPIFRYYLGSKIFPDVLLNDISGPDGDPLLLSLKLAVDVLVFHSEPISYYTGLFSSDCSSLMSHVLCI